MILTIITLLIILLNAWKGFRVGITRAIMNAVLFVLVWFFSIKLSRPIAEHILINWPDGEFVRNGVPDNVLHQGTAFLASGIVFIVLYAIGYLIIFWFMSHLKLLRKVKVTGMLDKILGAIIYTAVSSIFCFFVLQILSVFPNAWLQKQFAQADLINIFLNRFPFLAENIYQWWLDTKPY